MDSSCIGLAALLRPDHIYIHGGSFSSQGRGRRAASELTIQTNFCLSEPTALDIANNLPEVHMKLRSRIGRGRRIKDAEVKALSQVWQEKQCSSELKAISQGETTLQQHTESLDIPVKQSLLNERTSPEFVAQACNQDTARKEKCIQRPGHTLQRYLLKTPENSPIKVSIPLDEVTSTANSHYDTSIEAVLALSSIHKKILGTKRPANRNVNRESVVPLDSDAKKIELICPIESAVILQRCDEISPPISPLTTDKKKSCNRNTFFARKKRELKRKLDTESSNEDAVSARKKRKNNKTPLAIVDLEQTATEQTELPLKRTPGIKKGRPTLADSKVVKKSPRSSCPTSSASSLTTNPVLPTLTSNSIATENLSEKNVYSFSPTSQKSVQKVQSLIIKDVFSNPSVKVPEKRQDDTKTRAREDAKSARKKPKTNKTALAITDSEVSATDIDVSQEQSVLPLKRTPGIKKDRPSLADSKVVKKSSRSSCPTSSASSLTTNPVLPTLMSNSITTEKKTEKKTNPFSLTGQKSLEKVYSPIKYNADAKSATVAQVTASRPSSPKAPANLPFSQPNPFSPNVQKSVQKVYSPIEYNANAESAKLALSSCNLKVAQVAENSTAGRPASSKVLANLLLSQPNLFGLKVTVPVKKTNSIPAFNRMETNGNPRALESTQHIERMKTSLHPCFDNRSAEHEPADKAMMSVMGPPQPPAIQLAADDGNDQPDDDCLSLFAESIADYFAPVAPKVPSPYFRPGRPSCSTKSATMPPERTQTYEKVAQPQAKIARSLQTSAPSQPPAEELVSEHAALVSCSNYFMEKKDWLQQILAQMCPDLLSNKNCPLTCHQQHAVLGLDKLPVTKVRLLLQHLRFNKCMLLRDSTLKTLTGNLYRDWKQFNTDMMEVILEEVHSDLSFFEYNNRRCTNTDALFNSICQPERVHPTWIELAEILPSEYEIQEHIIVQLINACVRLPASSISQEQMAKNIIRTVFQNIPPGVLKSSGKICRPLEFFEKMLSRYYPEQCERYHLLNTQSGSRHRQNSACESVPNFGNQNTFRTNMGHEPPLLPLLRMNFQQRPSVLNSIAFSRYPSQVLPAARPNFVGRNQYAFPQQHAYNPNGARMFGNLSSWPSTPAGGGEPSYQSNNHFPPNNIDQLNYWGAYNHTSYNNQLPDNMNTQMYQPAGGNNYAANIIQQPGSWRNANDPIRPTARSSCLDGKYSEPFVEKPSYRNSAHEARPERYADNLREKCIRNRSQRVETVESVPLERPGRKYKTLEDLNRFFPTAANAGSSGPSRSPSLPEEGFSDEETCGLEMSRVQLECQDKEFEGMFQDTFNENSHCKDLFQSERNSTPTIENTVPNLELENDKKSITQKCSIKFVGEVVTLLYKWCNKPEAREICRALFLALVAANEEALKIFGTLTRNCENGNSGLLMYGPKMKDMLSAIGVNLYLELAKKKMFRESYIVMTTLIRHSISLQTNEIYNDIYKHSMAHQMLVCVDMYTQVKQWQAATRMLLDNGVYQSYREWKLKAVQDDEIIRNEVCEKLFNGILDQHNSILAYEMFMAGNASADDGVLELFGRYTSRLLLQLVNDKNLTEAMQVYKLPRTDIRRLDALVVRGLVASLKVKELNKDAVRVYNDATTINTYYPFLKTSGSEVVALIHTSYVNEEVELILEEFFQGVMKKCVFNGGIRAFIPRTTMRIILQTVKKPYIRNEVPNCISNLDNTLSQAMSRTKRALAKLSRNLNIAPLRFEASATDKFQIEQESLRSFLFKMFVSSSNFNTTE